MFGQISQKKLAWESRCNNWGFWLLSNSEILSTIWMSKTGNQQQENLVEIM